jgi:hypothetical protein
MTASAETSAVAHGSEGRVPDFFIVGNPKGGTTALYEMLRRQSRIYMPVKEPWFFAPDRLGPESERHGDTLAGYLSLFAGARADQLIGEASPSYLMSAVAAGRIAELRPDARIIAILREPASFLRSLHLQSVQDHVETEKDLRKAIALEPARRAGKEIPRYSTRPRELLYSEHVRYVEQLRRYHSVFPSEQVLVLIYEDFRNDNDATVRRVLRFLDLENDSPIEAIEVNPTVSVRFRGLYEVVRSLYLGRGPVPRAGKAAVKMVTTRRMRRGVQLALQRRVLWGEPPVPDEDIMLELRRRFKDEVMALSEYLGRDLVKLWGYDDIG